MKLEIGIPDYPFEHNIKGATLRGRLSHKPVPVLLVSIEDMKSLHKKLPNVRATPSYIAFDGKRVWLHPSPSGEFHLDIVPDFEMEKNPPVEITEVAATKEPGRFDGKITKAVAQAFGKKV